MSERVQTTGLERRREDYGSITGRSLYVDDRRALPGRPPTLHMVVVRSIYAHAEITNIQLDAARSLSGVIAAFEGAELVNGMRTLDSLPMPGLREPERRPLAVGHSRYVGDPIAVILAENLPIAEDALDLVDVDYKVLPAVIDAEAALEADAPHLYDEF